MHIRDMEADDAECVQRIFTYATRELRAIYRPTTIHGRAPANTTEKRVPVWRRRVIVHSDRVQGVVDFYSDKEQLFLRGLAVNSASRGRGYAKALLGSLEETAIELGVSRINLTTIQETGNVNFFSHLGYEVVKQTISSKYERVDLATPATEVEMVKRV